MTKPHIYSDRVQFEDVDAGQAVHHPNYWKYCERARISLMNDLGTPFLQQMQSGYAFVVAEVHGDYKRSLRLEQSFWVVTKLLGIKRSSLRLSQIITHLPVDDPNNIPSVCFQAQIRLVLVSLTQQSVVAIPDNWRKSWGILDPVPADLTDVRIP